MIKNYLKLGLRSLQKQRLSSAINIFSLALAVGCCMVVFKFFDWSMHMDEFHHKLADLFVIEKISRQNGNEQLWGNSPAPMGPMLKNDFSQVRNMTRVSRQPVVIKQGDNVFRETVSFVDDSFYQMFDFPVKWGNVRDLTDPAGMALSWELSQKLFGTENPVGRPVSIRFDLGGQPRTETFTVKGVFDKRPSEASWYFSALIPYEKSMALGVDKPGDWSKSVNITFIEAKSAADLQPVNAQLKKYLQLYNASNRDDKIVGFNFQPLNTMSFHAYKVNNEQFATSHIAAYIMLLVIGIATLLLVYFNYMNIAIASAASRLKEIGVRKVMGSTRWQIILQFILENIIVCTIAVVIGVALAKFIFLPGFSQLANVQLGIGLFDNFRTWALLAILIVVSALGGAAYPAIYISAFEPVGILKGNSKMGSRNRFRKILLGFQFFLTFLVMSTAGAFLQETKKVEGSPWGYDPSDNVVVNLDKSANYASFRDELKNSGSVRSVTGATQALGEFSRQMVIRVDGNDQTVQGINALPGFATQLGIKILAGRDLSDRLETDQTSSALVNQTFLHQMHWRSVIGKNIRYQGKTWQIVGETNDFHYEDFHVPVGPMIITGCRPEEVNYVYAKTSAAVFTKEHAAVEKVWKKVNPDLPFEYHYQASVFDDYFNGFSQVNEVLGAASVVMIFISISGIFGLALIILGRKMKEISVRKVVGAGLGTIALLINREFLFAIGAAIVFGVPVSWLLVGTLFDQIVSHAGVSIWPFALSLLGLVVMTLLSVAWHIYRAYTSNPTKYLKEE